jgi:hypothetical protein
MRHETIYAVSDTTEISLPATQKRESFGHGSGMKQSKSIFLHSTISISEKGVPMGLLHQKLWTRDPETHGKKHQRKQLPIEEKESYKWIESAEGTLNAFEETAHKPHIVMVGDRENDIHEFFQYLHDHRMDGIVRSAHNRRLDPPLKCAWDEVSEAPVSLTVTTTIPRKPNQKERKATLEVRYLTGAILHPKDMKNRQLVPINIIQVTEELPKSASAKEKANAVQWKIYTTLDIQSGEDAWEIVQKYKYRWRVEEFHFILKSGCRIEKLQFENFERYKKAVIILSQVSIDLLRLKYLSRVHPDMPASDILSDIEIFVLKTKGAKLIRAGPSKKLSIKDAMAIVGRMGGHLGRKGDGPPGIKTLWHGWSDLQTIVDFMRALKNSDSNE